MVAPMDPDPGGAQIIEIVIPDSVLRSISYLVYEHAILILLECGLASLCGSHPQKGGLSVQHRGGIRL